MNTNMSELDPLNTYEYSYGFDHIPNLHPSNGYLYGKLETAQPSVIQNLQQTISSTQSVEHQNNDNRIDTDLKLDVKQTDTVKENSVEINNVTTEDSKEDIKPIIDGKKIRKNKKTGKVSSYWSKKIADRNFPFYGCTICQISFTSILDLDQHVTVHKGRLTSYDIRLRNKVKKKLMKKQKKKTKKLGKKVKRENITPDIEIKPEDGYIGTEETSKFNDNNEGNSVVKENSLNIDIKANNSNNNDENTIKVNDKNDPRLQRLFKCFACHKEFALSYYLKLHVRSHTDEKPYTCAECGQSFITASKLGRHNKRIHLAIRYQCRICYTYFFRFDYLTRHFDKKHAEDKLDGEPYDYNAILPYIKELEEQLREKELREKELREKELGETEVGDKELREKELEEKHKRTEEKLNTKDLWADWPQQHQPLVDRSGPQMDQDSEDDDDSKDFFENSLDIIVEEVKVAYDDNDEEMEIKKEKEEEMHSEGTLKEDEFSFFDSDCPSTTWAVTPKPEPAPESPGSPPPKPKRKRSNTKYPKKCEICDKVINSTSYMSVHLRSHTGEKPFVCHICKAAFVTSSRMHRHIMTHANWQDAENQVKIEEGKAERKKKNASTKKGKLSKKQKKEGREDDGFKREYQKRTFACPYCGKRFLRKETMVIHKKTHEGEPLVLRCTYCLDELPDEESLRAHEATHTGPRPYVCTLCNKCYKSKESMIYHRKNHTKDTVEKREFVCDICSKAFNAHCKLQRHLVAHNVNKFVLRYECPVCAHMFNTKYHVQMHLSTHQKEGLILEENRNEILAMVMQNARKIPKKPDAHVSAVDLIPPDERSRVCNICGQVFQHFYYLEEHLKSHGSMLALEQEDKNEERTHICKICNKGFKLHYYLKLHSYTHTKERPFICQQCGKGFITKGKLKRHIETHSGVKKYQCHICYKFFTRPSYLRIHVRTIHGTQDYNFRVNKQYSMPFSQNV